MEDKMINKIKCFFGFHGECTSIDEFECFCTYFKCSRCGHEDWSLE